MATFLILSNLYLESSYHLAVDDYRVDLYSLYLATGSDMKSKKLTVLRLKQILRLHYQANLSTRQLALSIAVSRGTISNTLAGTRFGLCSVADAT